MYGDEDDGGDDDNDNKLIHELPIKYFLQKIQNQEYIQCLMARLLVYKP